MSQALEIKILAGAESKQFLVNLEALVKRMEAITTTTTTTTTTTPQTGDDDYETEETETGFTETEEEGETEADFTTEEEEEEEEEETPPKKAAKAKTPKLTQNDVNQACIARMKYLTTKKKMTNDAAFKAVRALLKKNFKTESVSTIAKEDYMQAISILSDY